MRLGQVKRLIQFGPFGDGLMSVADGAAGRAGLNVNQLATLHGIMARHVGDGRIPGLVTGVYRRGEVHLDVIGHKTLGLADPMRQDTIFRISSMTKPITAAAAMILVDDGAARLDDPVDDVLPELAGRRVLRRLDGPLDDTVPAERPITLRDLLTFRLGFGLVWGPPDALPIQRAASELQLGAFGPPRPLQAPPPDEWLRRFATLPLMHQPGDRWMYNTGSELLGIFVARASGKPLDSFLAERIFEPLGMKDTAFSVPPSKLHRLASSYIASNPSRPDECGSDLYDGVLDSQWSKPPLFPSGGAGLVSTAGDFLAFARMMLGGGALDGARILSRASVEMMTTDHLTAAQKERSDVWPPGFWRDHGWGFGVSVVTAPDALSDHAGRYGWDGGLGTSWWSDPREDTIAILLTQRSAFPSMTAVYRDFWQGVYKCIRSG
jgi:CubicO group peptidase (beta-lactamase class C family)